MLKCKTGIIVEIYKSHIQLLLIKLIISLFLVLKISCQSYFTPTIKNHINGLVQDWNNSIANTLELLQSCTKPLLSWMIFIKWRLKWTHSLKQRSCHDECFTIVAGVEGYQCDCEAGRLSSWQCYQQCSTEGCQDYFFYYYHGWWLYCQHDDHFVSVFHQNSVHWWLTPTKTDNYTLYRNQSMPWYWISNTGTK